MHFHRSKKQDLKFMRLCQFQQQQLIFFNHKGFKILIFTVVISNFKPLGDFCAFVGDHYGI